MPGGGGNDPVPISAGGGGGTTNDVPPPDPGGCGVSTDGIGGGGGIVEGSSEGGAGGAGAARGAPQRWQKRSSAVQGVWHRGHNPSGSSTARALVGPEIGAPWGGGGAGGLGPGTGMEGPGGVSCCAFRGEGSCGTGQSDCSGAMVGGGRPVTNARKRSSTETVSRSQVSRSPPC